jgi:alpha-L-fucosidase
MVVTTRHHDGFCLFDSAASDFTAPKTAAGRDFIAEYVEAARRAGLRVGVYYSLLDWRFAGYWEAERERASAEAMVAQAHAQVRELVTNYGRIDLLWYDGGWLPHVADRPAAAEFWRAAELNAMVRSVQPHIVINNRSGLDEDLDTPEQRVAASRAGRGWESCMTMGASCGWGCVKNNPAWKTVPQLIEHLATAASGEGNYLLNVGPKPDGSIRKEERVRLAAIGEWLRTNGEAIYDSRRSALAGGMIGLWTCKGSTGYLIILRWPGREATVPLVATPIKGAWLLGTGEPVSVERKSNGRAVFGGLPPRPPHPAASVIKVEFEGEPQPLAPADKAAWLVGKA